MPAPAISAAPRVEGRVGKAVGFEVRGLARQARKGSSVIGTFRLPISGAV